MNLGSMMRDPHMRYIDLEQMAILRSYPQQSVRLERYGMYLLIRDPERDVADHAGRAMRR